MIAWLFALPGLLRRLIGLIPPRAWLAIGLAMLLGLGWIWHGHAVRKAHDAAFAEGADARDAQWKTAFETMQRQARDWRAAYEGTAARLSAAERTRHEQDLRRIADAADDLRLRGPGHAAAGGCARPGNDPEPAAATGGPGQPGGSGNAPVDPLPADEALAIVPWTGIVRFAQQHDAWRAEALSWRSWYWHQAEALRRARGSLVLPTPQFTPEKEPVDGR